METQVIDFIPPFEGLDTEFNTFRIGGALAKRLTEGQEIFLMNGKNKVVFGRAEVVSVEVGKLGELCLMHAAKNHRELANDPTDAPERLFKYLQKIYGPHIAKTDKKSCVVYMRRLE